jgi:hypothetical protein
VTPVSAVATSTTSALLVALNNARKGLMLQNSSRSIAYVDIAAGVSKANCAFTIPGGSGFPFPARNGQIYNGALYATWDEAEGEMLVQEG